MIKDGRILLARDGLYQNPNNYMGTALCKTDTFKRVARDKQNKNPMAEPTTDYRYLLSAQTQLKLIMKELNEATNS